MVEKQANMTKASDFKGGPWIAPAELAESKRPFMITKGDLRAGLDMRGKPMEKIEFLIIMGDNGDEHLLTLGATPVRQAIKRHLDSNPESPIGWCILKSEPRANNQSLWVFEDWDNPAEGVQEPLPLS